MSFFLDAVYLCLLVVTLPWWIYRAIRTGKYRTGLWDRFRGVCPAKGEGAPTIWLHAVSVGEVLLLRRLIERLDREHPEYRLVLSSGTDAGLAVAKEKYPAATVFRAPLDFSWAVKRVLDVINPSLLILAELELWPNLLLLARKRGIPVVVVNARMSERSFRGYRRIQSVLRPVFQSVVWWGCQTEEYASRIRFLLSAAPATGTPGVCPITVTGSLKYDGAATDRNQPATLKLRRLLGIEPHVRVLVAGSTQPEENETVLTAFLQLSGRFPELRLILVPRHPEHFEATAERLRQRGLRFVRRSELHADLAASAPVTLIDTVGELGAIWGLAEMGFVGGSLVAHRGGQSMIEPAAFGVAVCFGPNVWNFKDTVDRLLACQGAVMLANADSLVLTLRQWLEDPASARELGRKARRFIQSQQGALDRTLLEISKLLEVPVRGAA